jgi:hypothetical protein
VAVCRQGHAVAHSAVKGALRDDPGGSGGRAIRETLEGERQRFLAGVEAGRSALVAVEEMVSNGVKLLEKPPSLVDEELSYLRQFIAI